MQLSLSRSTIRSYRTSDATSLMRAAGTYGVARFMSEMPHPYSLQNADEWIGIASGGAPETHFAITVADEVIGGIGITLPSSDPMGVLSHSAEIGYWLSEAFWGRGIMTEALVALTGWGFTALHLIRLHASVYAPNAASARVLVKAGYEFEGRQRARYRKEGQLMDGLMFSKIHEP